MDFHPLAEIFPLMEGAEFDGLVADIKANGLREPIVLHEEKILDGRNRYRACKAAEIEPTYEQWENGSDPRAFVISKNLHRRHLNESQRAMIAARLANLKHGDVASQGSRDTRISISQAAELLNISKATVAEARTVLEHATPDEIQAVEAGEVAASTVGRQIRAKVSADTRAKKQNQSLSQSGKNPERIQKQQLNAEIWARLSDAIHGLTNLPAPADVATLVSGNVNRRRVVDDRLARSLQWLKDFSDAWNAEQVARPGDADARACDRVA